MTSWTCGDNEFVLAARARRPVAMSRARSGLGVRQVAAGFKNRVLGGVPLKGSAIGPTTATKPPKPPRDAMACGVRVKVSKIAGLGTFLWRERPLPLPELKRLIG